MWVCSVHCVLRQFCCENSSVYLHKPSWSITMHHRPYGFSPTLTHNLEAVRGRPHSTMHQAAVWCPVSKCQVRSRLSSSSAAPCWYTQGAAWCTAQTPAAHGGDTSGVPGSYFHPGQSHLVRLFGSWTSTYPSLFLIFASALNPIQYVILSRQEIWHSTKMYLQSYFKSLFVYLWTLFLFFPYLFYFFERQNYSDREKESLCYGIMPLDVFNTTLKLGKITNFPKLTTMLPVTPETLPMNFPTICSSKIYLHCPLSGYTSLPTNNSLTLSIAHL